MMDPALNRGGQVGWSMLASAPVGLGAGGT